MVTKVAEVVGVEEELLTHTKIKVKGKKESDARYRARLVRAGSNLEDGDWGSLSEGAQEWVNAGVEAINEKDPIADFPDIGKVSTPRKKEEKKVEKKAEAPATNGAPKKKRGAGAYYRRVVILNPDWGKEQLLKAVEDEGFTLSAGSAECMYYEIHGVLKILEELGMLTKPKKKSE